MSRVMNVVEFEVRPEHREAFLALIRDHAEKSRAEDGCLQFDVLEAQADPAGILLIEAWRDQLAFDVHARVPRLAQNRETYTPWVVSRKATRCNVW